jgi:monomeric isocitrate dehydrogenase
MWKMKKSSGTGNNPFKVLVGNLTTEWKFVSINYLKEVHDTINAESNIIKTYGDAFDILEYLANAKVIDLVPVESEEGIYKIRKIEYNG